MKLLFDQNLSPRLVARLSDLFPHSQHVMTLALDSAPDVQVWTHARDHGFAIVSKDEDFSNLSVLRGLPPKVVWLQLGNCTTTQVETAIRANASAIKSFGEDPDSGTFVLR